MKRFGQVIKIKKDRIEEYKDAHAKVWPDVLNQISQSNIRNYSIFLFRDTLFAYFEYHGDNFKQDMAQMADDPRTQEWWSLMKPMQQPVDDGQNSEWWTDIEEVFHLD